MIDRGHTLPLVRQARLLKLSRGGVYYTARPVTPANLAIMCSATIWMVISDNQDDVW